MDSIKKIIKGAVWAFAAFCAFCILVATCSDDENESNNQAQTEQKVETEQQSEVKETKKEKVEEKKEDSIFGTYEVTDKVGTTLIITLNEDESATIRIKGNEIIYYCSYSDFREINEGLCISFEAGKDRPIPVFDGGVDKDSRDLIIKDGWLYSYFNTAKAKDPEWRLKITKTK